MRFQTSRMRHPAPSKRMWAVGESEAFVLPNNKFIVFPVQLRALQGQIDKQVSSIDRNHTIVNTASCTFNRCCVSCYWTVFCKGGVEPWKPLAEHHGFWSWPRCSCWGLIALIISCTCLLLVYRSRDSARSMLLHCKVQKWRPLQPCCRDSLEFPERKKAVRWFGANLVLESNSPCLPDMRQDPGAAVCRLCVAQGADETCCGALYHERLRVHPSAEWCWYGADGALKHGLLILCFCRCDLLDVNCRFLSFHPPAGQFTAGPMMIHCIHSFLAEMRTQRSCFAWV